MSDPVYQWPWNDDDRNWIPQVLESGILWSTYSPTIDAGEIDLIIKEALLNNDSPEGWTEQGGSGGDWNNADSNPETIWTDSKKQDGKWNQT